MRYIFTTRDNYMSYTFKYYNIIVQASYIIPPYGRICYINNKSIYVLVCTFHHEHYVLTCRLHELSIRNNIIMFHYPLGTYN